MFCENIMQHSLAFNRTDKLIRLILYWTLSWELTLQKVLLNISLQHTQKLTFRSFNFAKQQQELMKTEKKERLKCQFSWWRECEVGRMERRWNFHNILVREIIFDFIKRFFINIKLFKYWNFLHTWFLIENYGNKIIKNIKEHSHR